MGDDEPKGCLAAILSLFGIGIGSSSAPVADTKLPFRQRDDFLSAAEHSFYKVLANAVGDRAVICCKVNLADLFFVVRPNENLSYQNKINRKHVDFLLCDPASMKPQCGVELDDASHARRDRQNRDEFFDKVFDVAGLPLVRVPAQTAYSPAGLLGLVEPHLNGTTVAKSLPPPAPSTDITNCPKCCVPMVERLAKKGPHTGKRFLACPNYPKCREVVALSG